MATGSHNITAAYTATATHNSSNSPVLIQRITSVNNAIRLHIYPNPVTNDFFYLQMSNMPQGNYILRLLNSLGQIVMTRQTNLSGNSTETIMLGERIKGVYYLDLTKPDKTMSSHKIIIL